MILNSQIARQNIYTNIKRENQKYEIGLTINIIEYTTSYTTNTKDGNIHKRQIA